MDWNILASAVAGGLFVLIGSYIESVLSSKKHEDQRENNLKISILKDLIGNRMGLSDGLPSQNEYRKVFMRALNQVPIVFNKNKMVIEKFNDFSYHLSTQDKTAEMANEKLYELIQTIYDDVNLEPPSKDVFFRTIF